MKIFREKKTKEMYVPMILPSTREGKKVVDMTTRARRHIACPLFLISAIRSVFFFLPCKIFLEVDVARLFESLLWYYIEALSNLIESQFQKENIGESNVGFSSFVSISIVNSCQLIQS